MYDVSDFFMKSFVKFLKPKKKKKKLEKNKGNLISSLVLSHSDQKIIAYIIRKMYDRGLLFKVMFLKRCSYVCNNPN